MHVKRFIGIPESSLTCNKKANLNIKLYIPTMIDCFSSVGIYSRTCLLRPDLQETSCFEDSDFIKQQVVAEFLEVQEPPHLNSTEWLHLCVLPQCTSSLEVSILYATATETHPSDAGGWGSGLARQQHWKQELKAFPSRR